MKILASIIIPNWNGKHLLEDCLASLGRQSIKDFEIILVDNASTDGSPEYAAKKFPSVRIIKSEKNLGFSSAINKGVKASNARYVVFLNNDTEIEEDWLKNLIDSAKRHPEAISVNSKLLNYYDRKRIDGVGILINEVGQARSIGWREKDHGQYNSEQYIFGATGGGSLFKRAEFIKIGMFDEKYFMYSEEVDFAFRAQFQGYKSVFAPRAVIFHKHKATSGKLPSLIEYWQFRNMTQTIIKDFPGAILCKKWRWLKIILVHFNTVFYQLRNGFWWPPFLAMFWIAVNLPRLLKERKKVQSKIKVSDEYIESFLTDKKITFWGLRRQS